MERPLSYLPVPGATMAGTMASALGLPRSAPVDVRVLQSHLFTERLIRIKDGRAGMAHKTSSSIFTAQAGEMQWMSRTASQKELSPKK